MDKNRFKDLIQKENPIIFEIGCADGIDTIEFLSVFGDLATFFCFEPDVRNANVFLCGGYRELRPELTRPITEKNVIFEQKAVGNVDGVIPFNQSSTIYSSSLKKPKDHVTEWPTITFNDVVEVECVKLDTYVENKNIELIDLIWADVQGAEDLLINGGKNTFDSKVRYLYTEYSKKEYYENAPDQYTIQKLLGDNWEIVEDLGTDVLLKNITLL